MDAENGTITNLTLNGNGAAMVILLDRPGITADTIEVKNFTHIGIVVPASGCRITKCLVSGLGTADAPSMSIWHNAGKIPTKSTITIGHSTIQNNGMCGIYCTGGEVIVTNNRISGNHIITSPGGGQIDIGNAFTTNTVAIIRNNTISDGGTLKAGGIEAGGGDFTVTNNTIRNHGSGGIGLRHNVIQATVTGNIISNCGRNLSDRNTPQNRSAIYVGYGATNVVIAGNRCFDDQPNKTQTWGVILVPPPRRADPRFAPKATEHVVIRENDVRGNLHPDGCWIKAGPETEWCRVIFPRRRTAKQLVQRASATVLLVDFRIRHVSATKCFEVHGCQCIVANFIAHYDSTQPIQTLSIFDRFLA